MDAGDKLMQGDVEALLREASRIEPHPLVADDPRINSYGRQLATMLLTRRKHSPKNNKGKGPR